MVWWWHEKWCRRGPGASRDHGPTMHAALPVHSPTTLHLDSRMAWERADALPRDSAGSEPIELFSAALIDQQQQQQQQQESLAAGAEMMTPSPRREASTGLRIDVTSPTPFPARSQSRLGTRRFSMLQSDSGPLHFVVLSTPDCAVRVALHEITRAEFELLVVLEKDPTNPAAVLQARQLMYARGFAPRQPPLEIQLVAGMTQVPIQNLTTRLSGSAEFLQPPPTAAAPTPPPRPMRGNWLAPPPPAAAEAHE